MNKKRYKIAGLIFILATIITLFLLIQNQLLHALARPLCKNCNIILVSVDTFSANHLPCYGYAVNTAPNLCRFAKNNMLFQNMYANAQWTLPGHASIFTGLYPTFHGINAIFTDRLQDKTSFLPDILHKQGYETIFDMPSNDNTLPIQLVYSRGITSMNSISDTPWKKALDIFSDNVSQGKKSFLFLHTYDIHSPYTIEGRAPLFTKEKIPQILIDRSGFTKGSSDLYKAAIEDMSSDIKKDIYKQSAPIYKEILAALEKKESAAQKEKSLLKYQDYLWGYYFKFNYLAKIDIHNKSHIDYIRALYDQRIYETDSDKIATVLSYLAKDDIHKNTILIITSDHGEEFMEHGHIVHETVYDSNLKIPLIVYVPGITKPVQSLTPVQSVDILPTVLDLVGIPYPSFVQGASLVPLMRGGKLQKRLLVADGINLENRTLRTDDGWKLFLAQKNNTYVPYELYNTKDDPGETNNILFSHQDGVQQITQSYGDIEKKWISLSAK